MEQPAWESTPDGIVLPVQVQPRARRNTVLGVRQGRLLVAVTAPPEDGKANNAVVNVLAEAFEIKRPQISLTAGATSPRKRFLITACKLEQLQRRLAELPG